jgi:LmbE family N-acetylglucosaminyl deacetylase
MASMVSFGLWRWAFASVLMFAPHLGASQDSVKSLSNSRILEENVFVVAHQDDWQLFMGDVVAQMVKSGAPTTFIYLTAGDDGRDSVYWKTREKAALSSTRLAAGFAARSDTIGCTIVQVLEHTIRKCVIGNTRSFFLRLPDGKRNGTGFAQHDHQSMRRLRAGKITSITALDGSTSYNGWKNLLSTVSALIPRTTGLATLVSATDPSIVVNPHDHYDHRMAGLLVEELRRQRNFAVRYYVGYALATRADNRSNEQARLKTAIFTAYDREMMRVNEKWSAYREHPAFYSECMLRTYARAPGMR